jgi:hypothetical protein
MADGEHDFQNRESIAQGFSFLERAYFRLIGMFKDYHNGVNYGNAKSHKLFAKFAKGVSRIYKVRLVDKYFSHRFVKTSGIRTITPVSLMSLLVFALTGSAMELWVSPGGNDANPGTSTRPLASITHAEEKARAFRLEKPNDIGPIEVILRSGLYALQAPIRVRPEDSGRLMGPLIFAAAPGESPVLSGGIQIRGWRRAGQVAGLPKAAEDAVWVAKVPKLDGKFEQFRELWVDSAKAVRARTPNDESLTRLVAWDKTNEIATIPTSALAGATVPGEMEMIVDQVWEIAVLRVAAIRIEGSNALLTFKQPESRIEFQHPWPPVIVKTNYQAPFFLANAIQFLDAPGEWFEDLRAGEVYYWPREGEDLANTHVFAPVLESLVDIQGTLDNPVANVQFRGITFAHSSWLRPSEQGHVPLQEGMFMLDARKLSPKGTLYHRGLDNLAWIGRPPGAVSIKNANHISFKDCSFEHLASAGLDIQSGTHDDGVEGCVFRDIGGNGIQLGKFSDTNVETHVPYYPPDDREICVNERLANNLLTDCANEDWGCVGIGVGYARGIKIEHNEVSNCSYTGISVGWGWTKMTNALRDNLIHANHVHQVATRLNDTAGIYTLSVQPGTVISENSIHDITMSRYVPDPEHWFYLYLDEGSSYITVRDNWSPAEKFLKNANGPGNVWENNGPEVSQRIKNAAGPR